MQLPREYPYNPRWLTIFATAVFFGACCAVMAYRATENRAGLIINGIITLGPDGATTFYWVISALGAAFVILALLLTVRRLSNHRVLVLGTDMLLLPDGFFQARTSRIPYADIHGVIEAQVSGQTFLYVMARGRRFTVVASLFPDTASYVTVRNSLRSHVTDPLASVPAPR